MPRYKVTIQATDGTNELVAEPTEHADAEVCSHYLAGYCSDEYYEQGERDPQYVVYLPDLFRAFANIYTGLSVERDFSFLFDGELFVVQVVA